jgi:chromosome condensin MukBEF MukE localization factor
MERKSLQRVQKIVGHLAKNYILSKPVLLLTSKPEINKQELFENVLKLIEEKQFLKARNEILNSFPIFDDGEEMIRAYRLVGLTFYRKKFFDF